MFFFWKKTTTEEIASELINRFAEEERRRLDSPKNEEIYKFEDQVKDYFAGYYPKFSLEETIKYIKIAALICKKDFSKKANEKCLNIWKDQYLRSQSNIEFMNDK